jgi:hypothetical protein
MMESIIAMLPLVHVEFALSEIDYFAGVVGDRTPPCWPGRICWGMRTGSDRRRGGISLRSFGRSGNCDVDARDGGGGDQFSGDLADGARRSLFCWPLNLLACALYFKLFLDVRLYADMALQAAFGLGILYGWIVWSRERRDPGAVVVMPLSRPKALAGLALGAFGAVAIGWFTSRHTDAALPWMDATLSAFSLVAQYWTARRHREIGCSGSWSMSPTWACFSTRDCCPLRALCRDDRAGGDRLPGLAAALGGLGRGAIHHAADRREESSGQISIERGRYLSVRFSYAAWKWMWSMVQRWRCHAENAYGPWRSGRTRDPTPAAPPLTPTRRPPHDGPQVAPPWSEEARVAALHRYAILDTAREVEFDDIVRLAADISKRRSRSSI